MNGSRPDETRMMALTGAAMFAGGALIDLVEALVPGGETFSLLPGFLAVGVALLMLAFGSRMRRWSFGVVAALSVVMIADAVASTRGPGDGAVLYVWPVLWVAGFAGRRETVLVVLWVGLADGVALLTMPAARANLDSWIDVMSVVAVVGGVVHVLVMRSRTLFAHLVLDARLDELTGLLNRRGLREQATVEFARAEREGLPVGVAVFDLDEFKRINDEHGHETGDLVLERVGGCLRASLRPTDVAARLGGEEFVALLPGVDLDAACALTERVRTVLREPSSRGLPPVTVSAGVTVAFAPRSLDLLLRDADRALYAAKAQGRDRTVADRAGVSV